MSLAELRDEDGLAFGDGAVFGEEFAIFADGVDLVQGEVVLRVFIMSVCGAAISSTEIYSQDTDP